MERVAKCLVSRQGQAHQSEHQDSSVRTRRSRAAEDAHGHRRRASLRALGRLSGRSRVPLHLSCCPI